MENKRVFSNLMWRFAERCGAQTVSFVVSIVLARLLEPEVYGILALVTVFTAILQVFVDSGLGNALIQKKNADDVDFSTVFYANVVFCTAIYTMVFFVAPLIAKFYNNKSMTSIIRVLSLTILISGIKNIQQAYVTRNLLFKRFFYSTLMGTAVAAVVGIWLAYTGYGVWALVAQQIVNTLMDTIVLWVTVKWRPQKVFSLKRLKKLYSFGWKLLVSQLLDAVYSNIRQLIIGKMYSSADLAYYNRGRALPNIIVNNINASIDSVLLPTMSKEQDDCTRVKGMTRRAIKTSTYIMAPLMMGLAFTAKPVVCLLLTDKWIECIPYLRIFCITFMFYPIHTANLNAIKAMGRSDLFLKLEIIKKVVGMTVLFSTMWFGVKVMAYSLLVVSVISQIINSWPNKKLLNYSYLDQIKDILPNILRAVIMGICVYMISFLGFPDIVTLLIQIMLGAGIYIASSILSKDDCFGYLWQIIKPYMKNILHRA